MKIKWLVQKLWRCKVRFGQIGPGEFSKGRSYHGEGLSSTGLIRLLYIGMLALIRRWIEFSLSAAIPDPLDKLMETKVGILSRSAESYSKLSCHIPWENPVLWSHIGILWSPDPYEPYAVTIRGKGITLRSPDIHEKSRIRETKNLSNDADSRTNTVLQRLRDLSFFFK